MSYVRTMSRRRYGRRRAMGDSGSGITACPDPCDPSSASNLDQVAQYQAACESCGGSPGTPGSCTGPVPSDICDPCQTGANQQTAQLDQWTADLSHNWAPTGQYKPSDIVAIVNNVTALIAQAQNLITQAQAQSASQGIAQDMTVKSMSDNLSNDANQGNNFLASAQVAGSNGVVASPELKTWVIFTMTDCSTAIQAVYLSACNTSWFASAVTAISNAASAVWGFCKGVAGTVAAAGQVIANTADIAYQATRAGINVLSWVTSNPIPAIAIAAGIWWMLSEKNRERVKSAARTGGHVAKAGAKAVAHAIEVAT